MATNIHRQYSRQESIITINYIGWLFLELGRSFLLLIREIISSIF